MKKKFFFLPLTIFITLILFSFPANANDIQIIYPFAFAERFPGSAQHLGFPKGIVLQVGAYIYPASDGDGNPIPITRVTATNLDTELELYPSSLPIFERLYLISAIPLNPDYHMGVWRIEAEDEAGNEASADTHDLDMDGAMPYVKDIQASGDPLAPILTWRKPKEEYIPEFCDVWYRIRLLKNIDEQFFRSPLLRNLSFPIPEDVLNLEDLTDTYVRIEFHCWDIDDIDDFIPPYWPYPLELRSETFRPLQDLLFEIP